MDAHESRSPMRSRRIPSGEGDVAPARFRHQAHVVVLTHNGRTSPDPMFSLSVALWRLPHVEVEGVADIGCPGSKLEKKCGRQPRASLSVLPHPGCAVASARFHFRPVSSRSRPCRGRSMDTARGSGLPSRGTTLDGRRAVSAENTFER